MRRLSYQSQPISWKCLIAFITFFVSSAGAEPYRDTKNRYTLDLPDGWALKPIFGRADSVRFERKLRNSRQSAWLKLTVMPSLSTDLRSALDDYHRLELSPEFWSVEHEESEVFRSPGVKRVLKREVVRNVTKARVLHHLFFRSRDFVVSFELFLPSDRRFPSLFREVRGVVDSLQFTAVRELEPKGREAPTVSARDVVGRWFRPPNESLVLLSNGQFTIESQGRSKKGQFAVRAGRMILKRNSTSRFEVRLSSDFSKLTLTAEKSGRILEYTRRSSARRSFLGQWTRKVNKLQKTLIFHPNGYFEYGRMRGHWKAEGKQLVLVSANGSKLSYDFRFNEGFLIVSGGDFTEDVYFRKKRGS